jgi:hypothetical protein
VNPARNPFPLLALVALGGLSVSYAQELDTDWQAYGTAKLDDGLSLLFFDAAGVVRHANGHADVWTKGLPQGALTRALAAEPKGDDKILEFLKQRAARGYEPPLLRLVDTRRDLVMGYEAAANVSGVQPSVKAMFELDCVNRLYRLLSLRFFIGANAGLHDESPSEWRHVSPETPESHLVQIICVQH